MIKLPDLFNLFSIMLLIAFSLFLSSETKAQNRNQLVRVAEIEVDTLQLESYNQLLKEEIEASIRIEPGVHTLYGIADKVNPQQITIFETYADSSHYRVHLTTPHFQKYKSGTLNMVKGLKLIEAEPIIYIRKQELAEARSENLFIRLIKIKIDSAEIKNFNRLVKNIMVPGVNKEQGVLVMYAVAEKNQPTSIKVLEIYANTLAYQIHLKTPHFLKYKEDSKQMIKSLDIIDVEPIFLGAKSH